MTGPPEKAKGSAANRAPNTATITTTENSSPVILDFPQTTRTCSGAACWCRIGDYPSPLVMDHVAEMARMTRELRSIEVAGGVMGL